MSEPKVKEWMSEAAYKAIMDIAVHGAGYEDVARVIAEHCPDPSSQPIRRGDVVQCKPDGDYYFGGVALVMEASKDSACLFAEGWWSLKWLARIGRARYYPDGTPVEG